MADTGHTAFLALLIPQSIIHCWHYDILLPKQIIPPRGLQWSGPKHLLFLTPLIGICSQKLPAPSIALVQYLYQGENQGKTTNVMKQKGRRGVEKGSKLRKLLIHLSICGRCRKNRRNTCSPSQKSCGCTIKEKKTRIHLLTKTSLITSLLCCSFTVLKDNWSLLARVVSYELNECSCGYIKIQLLWQTGFFSPQLGSTSSCPIVVSFGRASETDYVCIQVLAFWLV